VKARVHAPNVLFAGETVRLERLTDGVRRLVLTRSASRNALNAKMIEEMSSALGGLAQLDKPSSFRLLLLEAEGQAFCAGADLTYMREQAAQGPAGNLADARALAGLFRRLASLPVPVLAAVRGVAMGGGVGLVACCDVVVTEIGTRFALPEVRLGLLPAVIGPYLVRKLGASVALELTLTSRRLNAWEALAAGLVHRVAQAPDMDRVVAETVTELLCSGPEAARRSKALFLKLAPLPSDEIEALAVNAIAEARASAEGQAGLAAILEKKKPAWVPARSRGQEQES
jgi:methylglutaconyl-CoA hydratase